MGGCCNKKNNEPVVPTIKQPVEPASTTKKSINDLKSSIFCGTKGFLTFNLAFLSYLEYSTHRNTKLKEGAVFAMKRNIIPLLEMTVIVPFVCFALPAMIGNISLIHCVLICAALMVATCFLVRTFHMRELSLEKWTEHSTQEIGEQFKKDTIKFPIFGQERKHIEYNSPSQVSDEDKHSSIIAFLVYPLNVLQSCIMLSLAVVELLETVPSFCVDLGFDWKFKSTTSNLQRSSHLLYASMRNLVPISVLDNCVANFIGIPEVTCCK